MSKLSDFVFGITRVVFALLFACHGAMKLFGAFGGHPMLHNPWMLTAGILEFGGGTLIGLGLFTRPVAFLLWARWPWPISSNIFRRATGPSRIKASWQCFTAFSFCT